ncbi:hypothetical protein DO021_18870 [Desulfobacter hydrogenophilus]|uniref:Uncharacterized protein n=1 Tax=Desulfobacter hydrogenophilus TaxID=2291 RepID=A0A328F7A8_9BACT|nr:hypothetical protein [Desulfobacter hydrogenophilus]NDY73831.1 hypothetical protein [Desulfobacter hydrogenophilus]QBH13158.1 hypothetical protein EYB58_09645 [Desulfobacter hydrogenophilus]RAM00448.1 hypothetical protein DO021_18870 [Desulfobacter hydrogenophilus]
MGFLNREKTSPVKYKANGKYALCRNIKIPEKEFKRAKLAGTEDAQKKKIPVQQTKASQYEKETQHFWERRIQSQVDYHAERIRQWRNMIDPVLDEFHRTKDDFSQRLKNRNYMVPHVQWNKLTYFIVMFVIIMVEVPINYSVFQAFGDEYTYFTYLLAFGLSFFLSMLAHFIGGWIKSEGVKFRSLGLILLVIVLLALIAWIRLKFFTGDEEALILEYFKEGVEIDLVVLFFFIFNTILFTVSIISSYMSHYSDPDFKQSEKDYKQGKMKLNNIFSAWRQEVNELERVIDFCQSAFKELRAVYIDAYEKEGAPKPMCFKETIGVDLDRMPNDFVQRLNAMRTRFTQEKSEIIDALKPVRPESTLKEASDAK